MSRKPRNQQVKEQVMENTDVVDLPEQEIVGNLPEQEVVGNLPEQEDPLNDLLIEHEVDMTDVGEPEAEMSDFAKKFLAPETKPVRQKVVKEAKQPQAPKTPIFGKRPKNGYPYGDVFIADRSKELAPHHQKQLIIDIIDFLGGEASMQQIVEFVESQETYWQRLKSRQSVYDCIHYHMKQMIEAGFLGRVKKIVTAPVVETEDQEPLVADQELPEADQE